ncbi:unnamed protein product [Rhizophagus irregularis]|nr:unnamed protein product [Rhizophagus irregularis]
MNSKNSFDPTPRLISSPIQILFFPFSLVEEFCDCENVYSNTCLFQKYCKNCSSEYIKKITNFNAYLDIYDGNGKHLHAQNITLENSHFKQIVTKDTFDIRNKYLNYCKLCCNERSAINCSVCYLISFTWIEFTSTSPVLHLPWWDTHNQCIVCDSELEFKSNCQKWCSNCFIIYTGCRYCLTTNIIFGITEKSQCMKCKRLSLIDINMSSDVKKIKEYFLKLNTHNFNQIANYVNNIDENSNLLEIYSFIKKPNYFPLSVLCSHIANLAGNNENSLNLIIPIMFIPFRSDEYQCYCCKKIYSETPFFKQQYCKDCLQWYIKYAISNIDSIKTAIGNLDAYVCTTNTVCNTKHKQRNSDFCIQEWCENCSEISYFKRIIINQQLDFENIGQFFEKNCSVYSIVSFTWMEFTSTSPVLHLPWWDTHNQCIVCDSELEFKSNCQKWCSNCFIIYTGCRYCLTTNIIFGNTEKTQCMNCKRLSWIDTNMPLDMKNIDHFLKFNTHNFNQIANFVNNIDKNSNLLDIYSFLKKLRFFNLKTNSRIFANLENNGDYLTIPIMFIPFKNEEDRCYCCENIYSETPFKQKFCMDCLYWCITNYATSSLSIKCAIDNLDVCIRTTSTNCDKHEPKNLDFCIQEWCENCSEILYFKQIVTNQQFDFSNMNYFYKENCRLCKKSIYEQNVQETFKLCFNCYSISFEFIESTLVKNHIPILHLQWWDAYDRCIMCNLKLKLKTDYQKWCSNCIIIYTGCRYCLTTNIIFGIIEKTQCMKCKRLSWIDINMPLDMKNIEYFLKFNTHNFNQIANFVNNIDKTSNLLEIYSFIKKLSYLNFKIYSQIIANLENNGVHSTIPNMFIPFKNEADRCYCCENTYSETLFKQKYCKYCMYWYINYATCSLNIKCVIDNLDICIRTTNTNCDKHEPKNLDFCIQEWCENCSEILYFKQIVTNQQFDFSNMNYFYKENCRLCKKSIYKQNVQETFKLCFNCYSISFEFIESTLVKNRILILYLPWWDAYDKCIICHQPLESKSNCQKYCSNCPMVYTGCRFCLTTNIIFGYINQSQCKRCKRIERIASIDTIDVSDVSDVSGNYNIDEFLNFTKFNVVYDYVNNINKNSNPLNIYKNNFASKLKIEWIPYYRITNLKEIAEGGYGKIYKASINGSIVAIKEFLNSQDPSKYFLNEIKSLYKCYDNKFEYIIKCHGITKNLMTNKFMFIMKYANGGDLHNYLQENFTKITWKKKMHILWRISDGRPEITDDTPEDFINLIKKCWNPDPRKRPSAKKICESFDLWANMEKDVNQFNQAEEIRLELIQSKLLGPESIGKSHSKAIYTSRPLSSFISKSSSTNASMISFKQEYVTKEYEFDINDIQRPSRDFIIENSNSQQVIYTSKPLSKLISEINPSGKRNIEDETQANGVDSKHVKISDEINPESQE